CSPDHRGCSAKHVAECSRAGKTPRCAWKRYQTERPDPATVRDWWKRWPASNVGLTMGPVSGLLGLDVDGDGGRQLLLEWAGGQENIPPTLAFTTPNDGLRLLFAWPDGLDVRIRSHRDPGRKELVRILATGSQTVAPPSVLLLGEEQRRVAYAWAPGFGPGEV